MEDDDSMNQSQISDTSSVDDWITAIQEQYPKAIVDIINVNNDSSATSSKDNGVLIDFDFVENNTLCNDIVQDANSIQNQLENPGPYNILSDLCCEDIDVRLEQVIEITGNNENNETVQNEDLIEDKESPNGEKDDPDFHPEEHEDVSDENGNTINNEEETLGVIRKKRRRSVNPNEWMDEKNKVLREKGQTYVGWSRPKSLNENTGELEYKGKRGTGREERKLGPPCQSSSCLKSKLRECPTVSEED